MNRYLTLCKPRVVMLMILTSMVGMGLVPHEFFSWKLFFLGNIGIALMACSAAAINHLSDQHIDRLMLRTQNRPVAQGDISTKNAIIFASILGVAGFLILILFSNVLAAILTLITLMGYAFFYTLFLKYRTPQNIVIGGLAGAAPPLLGWVAMTGHFASEPIILLLIIFVWTPPHFWALAIERVDEYTRAKVPMLPVTHGIAYTKKQIIMYTWILFAVTLLPFAFRLAGLLYLVICVAINVRFIQLAWQLKKTDDVMMAKKVFRFSIVYLMILFLALLADHVTTSFFR